MQSHSIHLLSNGLMHFIVGVLHTLEAYVLQGFKYLFVGKMACKYEKVKRKFSSN